MISFSYLLQRLGGTALVVLVVMTFLALVAHIVPGDPVRVLLGPRFTPELSERVRVEMGLDRPIPEQVFRFMVNALRGDLGRDFVNGAPVTFLIGAVLPHTILLALASLGLAVAVGVPLGVFSATRPDSWADRLTGALAVVCITMPSYVSGLLLLLVFSVWLRWLPALGAGSLANPAEYLRHLAMPATALALGWIGYLARLVRASILEVKNTDYIRNAFAYGLSERTIFYKLALKNAIIPTVAVLGVGLGTMLGGAIFAEVIFTRPGLGFLVYNAILERNYPIVRGGMLVVSLLFVLANLLADLSYSYLDPLTQAARRRP